MLQNTWDLTWTFLQWIIRLVSWLVTWSDILRTWFWLVCNDIVLQTLKRKWHMIQNTWCLTWIYLKLIKYLRPDLKLALKHVKPDLALIWRTWNHLGCAPNNLYDIEILGPSTWLETCSKILETWTWTFPIVLKTALSRRVVFSSQWDSWSQTEPREICWMGSQLTAVKTGCLAA